ncbi:hypothetical protein [Tropicibacter sp. S64]|uniref:hypothetical protein n=1 Tax=Tropicibacter sp. S64 TaxID=3415122 RepID=UPI003C7A3421
MSIETFGATAPVAPTPATRSAVTSTPAMPKPAQDPARVNPETFEAPDVIFDFGRGSEEEVVQVGYPDPYAPGTGFVTGETREAPKQGLEKAMATAEEDPVAVIRRLAMLAKAHEMFSIATAEGRATAGAMLDKVL